MVPLDVLRSAIEADDNPGQRSMGRQIAHAMAALWPIGAGGYTKVGKSKGDDDSYLGGGSYGKVYCVGWNRNSMRCAMKQFSGDEQEALKYFERVRGPAWSAAAPVVYSGGQIISTWWSRDYTAGSALICRRPTSWRSYGISTLCSSTQCAETLPVSS